MRGLMHGTGWKTVVLLAVYTVTPVGEAAPPEDAIGSWKLTCVCPDGKSRECVITITQEGRALKATYKSDGVTRAAKSVSFDRES